MGGVRGVSVRGNLHGEILTLSHQWALFVTLWKIHPNLLPFPEGGTIPLFGKEGAQK